MSLPPRGQSLPPREKSTSDKSADQIISEAPLKTSPTEQTNPIQSTDELKPWLAGEKLDEGELSNLTKIKSFNFDYLTLKKLDFVLNARKNERRSIGQKRTSETTLVLESVNKLLDAELKKMGYKP